MTYFNVPTTLVSAADASVSFTTSIDLQNFDNGGIEVVWSGLDGAAGTITMKGSISGTNYDVVSAARTMTTSTAFQLYGLLEVGFAKLQIVYAAAGNTTGTVSVYALPKSRR